MGLPETTPENVNDSATSGSTRTGRAQRGSCSVRYELIDKDGKKAGTFPSAQDAAFAAGMLFPDQSQDPDRSGAGWDVQVCGADR